MKKHYGLLCILALALPFAAGAQIIPNVGGAASSDEGDDGSAEFRGGGDRRAYVSGMFSYTVVDDDRATEDGIGGTIALGKRFTSGLNLELTGFYTEMDPETTGGTNTKSAKLTGYGAAAMIFPSQTFQYLYAVFALHQGNAENHPTTPASTDFSYDTTVFDSGLGYVFPLSPYLGGFEMALRAEARYRMDAHTRDQAGEGGQKHFYDYVANLGVMIPLGKLPVEAAPADVEVVEAAAGDSDGDGVPDDRDQCPDTPAGTSVNDQGCEGDTDGDGVVDRLDTCPETAAGTPVNEQGCPAVADADGDGVADDQDTCPATPAGTTVDETGCPPAGCRAPVPGEPINLEGCATGESVVLKGVNFEVNSTRLTANAKVILNQVADSLSAAPNMKVEIGGHTDAQGSDAFNQKLSQRRAQAVHDYLVARGIDPSRLSAKGYGESQPLETNETPEGRELNRRVQMKVIESGS